MHLERKKFGLLQNIYGRASKTSIYVSRESFIEKRLENWWIFSIFCTLRKKFSDFERKNSKQGFKTHLLRVHENILKKLSWKNDGFPINFVIWAKLFGTFRENNWGIVFKTSICVSRKTFCESFFYRIDGILVFSFLERKILGCWLKINDKVFKTTISIYRETIRDKLFFKNFS